MFGEGEVEGIVEETIEIDNFCLHPMFFRLKLVLEVDLFEGKNSHSVKGEKYKSKNDDFSESAGSLNSHLLVDSKGFCCELF